MKIGGIGDYDHSEIISFEIICLLTSGLPVMFQKGHLETCCNMVREEGIEGERVPIDSQDLR